jgi:glycosyltransferase involved in cell wall biosynthesis
MILTSRFEGFPNVLVEWQIAGLPCLISDKITEKVKITDLVEFESIDKSSEIWARHIEKIQLEDREKNQEKILEQIKKAGFDIKENAKKLEKIYSDIINNQ